MRCPLAALVLSLLPVVAGAQPRIVLEPERLDFGVLQGNETRDAKVTIRNAGTEVLEIRDIESTCGCTVPELAVRELAPGASTVMAVGFNSKTFQGPQLKYIHVYSNDPDRGSVDLIVTADIKVPLFMDPPKAMIEFTTVKVGETSTVTYTFRSEDVARLELTPQVWPEDWLEVEVRPGTSPQVALVDFTLRKDGTAGRHRDAVKIATNVPSVPVVNLEADVRLITDLVVGADRVNLGMLQPGGPVRSQVRVAPYRPDSTFKLTRAEIDIPGLKARVENGPRESFAIVTGEALPADHPLVVEKNGRIAGTLRIFTNLASTPELTIPVTYSVRR